MSLTNSRFYTRAAAMIAVFFSGCTVMEAYPPGPVTQNFQSWCVYPQSRPSTCPSTNHKVPDPPGFTRTLDNSIFCAQDTRDLYGEFLRCRENAQVAAGSAIAALAAAAAGVAAGGASAVAAASLGATAGAGLGLDYILYNKDKTKAYADATARLQCVIGESEPLRDAQLPNVSLESYPPASAVSPPDPLTQKPYDKIKSDLAELKGCEDKPGAPDPGVINLAAAKYQLAVKREGALKGRIDNQIPGEIFQTVSAIDTSAFTHSQRGVPDADQIKKAGQSVTTFIPSMKSAAPATPSAAQQQELSIEIGPAETAKAVANPCYLPLREADQRIEYATRAAAFLDAKLSSIQLPGRNFPECLAIKGLDETASSSSNKSASGKSTKSSTGGSQSKQDSSASDDSSDGSSDGSSKAGGGGSNSTLAQKPDKIAFQALPSDTVLVSAARARRSSWSAASRHITQSQLTTTWIS